MSVVGMMPTNHGKKWKHGSKQQVSGKANAHERHISCRRIVRLPCLRIFNAFQFFLWSGLGLTVGVGHACGCTAFTNVYPTLMVLAQGLDPKQRSGKLATSQIFNSFLRYRIDIKWHTKVTAAPWKEAQVWILSIIPPPRRL